MDHPTCGKHAHPPSLALCNITCNNSHVNRTIREFELVAGVLQAHLMSPHMNPLLHDNNICDRTMANGWINQKPTSRLVASETLLRQCAFNLCATTDSASVTYLTREKSTLADNTSQKWYIYYPKLLCYLITLYHSVSPGNSA